MTSKYGAKPELVWVDKRCLVIDTRYQRSIDTKASRRLIARMTKDFSWVKCMPLLITSNGDGTYCVIDGQHKLEAVKPLDEITELPCYLVEEMTLQQQALTFVDINTDRVGITTLATHHAKVRAGVPEAVEIERVAREAGCIIRRSSPNLQQMKNGELTCLGTIKRGIKQHGANVVIGALKCVRVAWPEGGGIRGEILQAAIDITAQHRGSVNLLDRLRATTPEEVIARAMSKHVLDGLHNLNYHIVQCIINSRNPVARVS